MKKPIKELKKPPEVKDDKMIRKESLLSSLLGTLIEVMGMIFAGVVLAIIFPSTKPILEWDQLLKAMAMLVFIGFLVSWLRSRL